MTADPVVPVDPRRWRRVTEWVQSWWHTYVHLSRKQRREIAAIIREIDTVADWIEVERPS